MTYDITVYIPGISSVTYVDRDEAFKTSVEEQSKDHENWKVTVCEHASHGNGRYR